MYWKICHISSKLAHTFNSINCQLMPWTLVTFCNQNECNKRCIRMVFGMQLHSHWHVTKTMEMVWHCIFRHGALTLNTLSNLLVHWLEILYNLYVKGVAISISIFVFYFQIYKKARHISVYLVVEQVSL